MTAQHSRAGTGDALRGAQRATEDAGQAGDLCPECAGKGYYVASYSWEWGDESEPRECPECAGEGYILPLVETEEFREEYPCQP